jgi:hypothetical protein
MQVPPSPTPKDVVFYSPAGNVVKFAPLAAIPFARGNVSRLGMKVASVGHEE